MAADRGPDCESARLELADALELNRRLSAAFSMGVLTFKASGQCVSANEAIARMVGASVDSLLKQNFRELRSWKDSGMLQLAFDALDSGESREGVFHTISTFGREVWFECHAAPVEIRGEQHLLFLINDLTERTRTAESLKQQREALEQLHCELERRVQERTDELARANAELVESRHMLRSVLDNIPVRVFWKGRDLRYMGCNQPFADDVGRNSPAEVVGCTDFDLVPPPLAERYRADDSEVINTGKPKMGYEEPMPVPGGAECYIRTSKVPLLDAEGSVLGVLGNFEIVTERRRAEEALRASEEKHRQLFESMTQGVVYQDPQGKITAANRAAERILGLTIDQMIGRTSQDSRWQSIHEDGSPFPGDTHPAMVSLRTGREVRNVVMGVFNAQQNEFVWIRIDAVPRFGPDGSGPTEVYTTFEDITDRKRAEEALRDSEERYRSVVTNTALVTFVIDEDGIFKLSEGKGLERLGLHPGQVVGKSAFDVYRDVPEVCASLRRALGGEIFKKEVRVGEVVFECWYSPVWDSRQKVRGALGVATDITDRKNSEEQLRLRNQELMAVDRILSAVATERELRPLLKKALQGALDLTGLDGGALCLLETESQTLRLAVEINVGRDLVQDHASGGVRVGDCLFAACSESARPVVVWDNGPGSRSATSDLADTMGIRFHASFPLLVRGQVIGILCIFARSGKRPPQRALDLVEDLGGPIALAIENARLFEAERAARERVTRILESISDGFVALDRDWRFSYVNRRAAEMIGREPEALLGKQIWAEFAEAAGTSFRRACETAMSGMQPPPVEELHVPSNRWMEHFIHPSPSGVSVYFHDITERKELQARFLQAQKMEVVGRLAGGVAHEFNNLLTIIMGNAHLLDLEPDLSEEARVRISEITGAAERSANLTRQLLAFARKQPVGAARVDINEILTQTVRMLDQLIGEDIDVECRPSPGLSAIQGDAALLGQVLLNLAVNARDAMPQGGRLVIASEAVSVDEEHVERQPAARLGRFMRISVSDTGTGIPPQVLPHLFEPFFTTKEVGKGTGLGLSTVYGIVQEHRGWIEVESRHGLGAAFHVYLPADGTPRPDDATVARPAADHVRGTETILLVEDEPAVRELLKTVLSGHGYRVIEAATGQEALELWKRERDRIDLLLTDLVMPGGLSGRELAMRLKEEKKALKVILTSGHSAEAADPDVRATGLTVLSKPYDLRSLAVAVRACLDKR